MKNKIQREIYEKEVNELIEEHIKKLTFHIGRIFISYSRKVWELNGSYYPLEKNDN